MSFVEDIAGDIAKTATPWGKVRLALIAVGAIIAMIIIGVVVYRVFFQGRALRTTNAQVTTQAEMNKGAAIAGQETVKVVVQHDKEVLTIRQQTEEAYHAVVTAQGAEGRAPVVYDVLLRTVCVRPAHSGDAACAALSGAGGSVGAAGGDPGSPSPDK